MSLIWNTCDLERDRDHKGSHFLSSQTKGAEEEERKRERKMKRGEGGAEARRPPFFFDGGVARYVFPSS